MSDYEDDVMDENDDNMSLEGQLMEAVYEHSMTKSELRSSTKGIEDSLYSMAIAFADSAANHEHIDDLKNALKTYGKLDGRTAVDQARHAFGVMEYKMETLS